jgi:hypothetical protein
MLKSHNEGLYIFYSSPNKQSKLKKMGWVGHVACMGESRKVYKVFVGKPEGKRPLGRLGHRWEDGIRMDLWKIYWG